MNNSTLSFIVGMQTMLGMLYFYFFSPEVLGEQTIFVLGFMGLVLTLKPIVDRVTSDGASKLVILWLFAILGAGVHHLIG